MLCGRCNAATAGCSRAWSRSRSPRSASPSASACRSAGSTPGLPQEYAPQEDRGSFRISMRGPEGASFEHAVEGASRGEQRACSSLIDVRGGAARARARARVVPFERQRELGVRHGVAQALGRARADHQGGHGRRRPAARRRSPATGRSRSPSRGCCGGPGQPVQFVLTGSTYEELARLARRGGRRRPQEPGPARGQLGLRARPSRSSRWSSTTTARPISASRRWKSGARSKP